MERGARIIRTDLRIAVSIRFSNARRHGRETADFATAIPPRLLLPSREGDIVDAIKKMKNSLCGGRQDSKLYQCSVEAFCGGPVF
jgi:hypothetical protein